MLQMLLLTLLPKIMILTINVLFDVPLHRFGSFIRLIFIKGLKHFQIKTLLGIPSALFVSNSSF